MNRLELFAAAYRAAVEASKTPHPEAASDGDGHCRVCGLPWPESEDDMPHLCPAGFFWKSP
jgi:hypothetical protein